MRNLKTTLSGAACLILSGFLFYLKENGSASIALFAGLGLLGAKDHNVTGRN